MVDSKSVKKVAQSGGELLETEFISVVFQKGFPAQVGINGCRIQDVLQIAIDRLNAYQQGPLACEENELALRHLTLAVDQLDRRIQRRREQGVFNTMGQHESTRTEDEDEDFSATGA